MRRFDNDGKEMYKQCANRFRYPLCILILTNAATTDVFGGI